MLTTLRASLRPLAATRILIAVGAAVTTLEGAAHLSALHEGKIAAPVAEWLPVAARFPVVSWFLIATLASLLLLIGVATRTSATLLAVGHAMLFAVDLQLYSNHRFLLVLLCAWLAFAGSDRVWAPGAQRRRRVLGRTVPWWPQFLIVATVSSCYLFAGLSKLNPEFVTGVTIAASVPSWVPAEAAAWATPPTEILIAVCLWFPRTRWVAIGLGAGLHLSIVVLMGAPLVFAAFALLCVSAYPIAGRYPETPGPSVAIASSGRQDVVNSSQTN